AEPVVELDAVEDLDRLGAADVLGLEVAVTVSTPAGGDARGEACALADEHRVDPPAQRLSPVVREDVFAELRRLHEVLVPVRANRVDAAEPGDLAAGRFGRVKARHDRADLLQPSELGAPSQDKLIQHAIVR